MAKRDRDTLIWKDPFYRSLPPLYKCFWDFINDDCDNSGVWGCDFKVASMVIGKKVNPETAAQLFGPRIEVSEDGNKWWIKTFIPERLGFEIDNLNPAHKFQKSIIDLLVKHKVNNFRVFADTLQSVKERKEQEKGKEGEGQGVQGDFLESNQIHIGTPNGHQVSIKPKYLNEKPIIIHSLEKYFETENQLQAIQKAGWTKFHEFMEDNPAKVFEDKDHLYNAFRNFNKYPKAQKIPSGKIRKEDVFT